MGEADGAGCAPSLLWLVSKGVGLGACALVFVSWLGMGFLTVVALSSDVFLFTLLGCEEKQIHLNLLNANNERTESYEQTTDNKNK